jgi:hypothetical protein
MERNKKQYKIAVIMHSKIQMVVRIKGVDTTMQIGYTDVTPAQPDADMHIPRFFASKYNMLQFATSQHIVLKRAIVKMHIKVEKIEEVATKETCEAYLMEERMNPE